MKSRLGLLLICFTISGLTLGGCAALKKGRKVEEPPEARLEKILLERALEYERKNQPHKALQSYEAALAVLVANKKRLEDSLRTNAEKHYRRGLELQDQGKYGKARHEFLTALRLWPDFPEVVELLKPFQPKPHTPYVVHRVEEGEFLATIAQKYYNDQSNNAAWKINAQGCKHCSGYGIIGPCHIAGHGRQESQNHRGRHHGDTRPASNRKGDSTHTPWLVRSVDLIRG